MKWIGRAVLNEVGKTAFVRIDLEKAEDRYGHEPVEKRCTKFTFRGFSEATLPSRPPSSGPEAH